MRLSGICMCAERGGGICDSSGSGLFRGLGRRGGTRRLKLATTSGGEWRFRVGWAIFYLQKDMLGTRHKSRHEDNDWDVHQVLASGSSMAGSTFLRLTLRMKP